MSVSSHTEMRNTSLTDVSRLPTDCSTAWNGAGEPIGRFCVFGWHLWRGGAGRGHVCATQETAGRREFPPPGRHARICPRGPWRPDRPRASAKEGYFKPSVNLSHASAGMPSTTPGQARGVPSIMDDYTRKRLLAIEVLLEEPNEINDVLETELYALRDRLQVVALS